MPLPSGLLLPQGNELPDGTLEEFEHPLDVTFEVRELAFEQISRTLAISAPGLTMAVPDQTRLLTTAGSRGIVLPASRDAAFEATRQVAFE